MCEINAYVIDNGKEILYFENIDVVIFEDKRVIMRNLFGEEMVYEGRIKELSFIKRRIILEKIDY